MPEIKDPIENDTMEQRLAAEREAAFDLAINEINKRARASVKPSPIPGQPRNLTASTDLSHAMIAMCKQTIDMDGTSALSQRLKVEREAIATRVIPWVEKLTGEDLSEDSRQELVELIAKGG